MTLVTTADKLRAEGREEAREENRREGYREGYSGLLADVLRRRFGALPPGIAERVERATPTECAPWIDRLFIARSIDEIFAD